MKIMIHTYVHIAAFTSPLDKTWHIRQLHFQTMRVVACVCVCVYVCGCVCMYGWMCGHVLYLLGVKENFCYFSSLITFYYIHE